MISLGDNVQINERVILQSCEGAQIVIGNRVTLSYEAIVLTGGYDLTEGIENKVHVGRSVAIEDEVWIGARATILPGVKIGRRAIVAAGSVVTKEVAQNTLVAGVPAKPLRDLTSGGH